jgi:GNAT superfamily N-acetyltransferase
MTVICQWRGDFTNQEVNGLHAEAFDTRVYDESEWNWVQLVHQHSLGWVIARDGTGLVGFVNVLWDGLIHAWLQDTMVAVAARGHGIGAGLVDRARRGAKAAGCAYLHVDFEARVSAEPASAVGESARRGQPIEEFEWLRFDHTQAHRSTAALA